MRKLWEEGENVLKGWEGERESCLILKWGTWFQQCLSVHGSPCSCFHQRPRISLFGITRVTIWSCYGIELHSTEGSCLVLLQVISVQSQCLRTIRKGTCLPDILFHLESVVYFPDILNLPTTARYFSLSISGWNYLSTFPTSSPPPLTCVMELNALSKGIGLRLPQASCVVISVFSGCKQCHGFQM